MHCQHVNSNYRYMASLLPSVLCEMCFSSCMLHGLHHYLDDTSAGSFGEAQSRNTNLRHVVKTRVIGHSANLDGDLVLLQ